MIFRLSWFFGYIKYGLVSLAVDMGTLFCLTEFAHLWYMFSAVVACFFGMITEFSLNKYRNFRDSDTRLLRQFIIFACIALTSIGLNLTLLYILTEFLGLWYMLSKIISVGLVFLWSYYWHSRVTFAMKDENARANWLF
jgi:putative flippase GtrA